MKSCLSEASSLNDYENITSGLRAQDVFKINILLSKKLLALFVLFGRGSEAEERAVVFE